jgi:hypothetical protein
VALLVNALAGFLTERFAAASETSAASAVQGGIVCISATHCNSSATLAGAIAASATLYGNATALIASAASAVQGGITCASATHCNSSATLAGAIAASATLGGNGIAFTCASATLSASSATSPCA